jgi:ribosomal protein S18 acetylase RimI-like enzyme
MVEVHRLAPDDWAEWRSLRLAALAESPHAFTTRLADWQEAGDSEERWRDRLTSVPFNIVARRAGTTVGMVSATNDRETGSVELLSLWVAPDARGSGVGDALVSSVVDWARDQAARFMVLRVLEGNEPAERLYERHGLRRSSRNTIGTNGAEIGMERLL